MKITMTKSSGNAFLDIGFPREESKHLLVRADLLIQTQKLIMARRPKQKAVAKILGIRPPRVSDLLRGRINLFSTDALIDLLSRLGAEVRHTVKALGAAGETPRHRRRGFNQKRFPQPGKLPDPFVRLHLRSSS